LPKKCLKNVSETVLIDRYAYPVAAGESGKLAGFSASYLKIAQNMP
jgi:hypothetical protein